MVLGESGIMCVCPPWCMPVFQPSLRRLTWPNGITAMLYSAEEPSRLRGPNFSHAWIDEPAAWDRAQETLDMLSFGLRIGDNPQWFATTTPRSTKFIKALLADPAVRVSKGSSYENRDNLAPSFFTEILARYEGTRLGAQEINADVLDTSEAAVFQNFSDALNVTEKAEHTGGDVFVAVDCGTSRFTAAVWAQCFERDRYRKIVTVFADYLAVDKTSSECAEKIKQLSKTLLGDSQIKLVLLDPASSARSALGPAARGEYARVFGERMVSSWPSHRVHDGIDQMEILVGGPNREPDLYIHPRAAQLVDAMKTYRRKEKRGEVLDAIEDPQHPAEDLCDSLRGVIRQFMPEGHRPQPNFRRRPASDVF
jgi:hypothetical protein